MNPFSASMSWEWGLISPPAILFPTGFTPVALSMASTDISSLLSSSSLPTPTMSSCFHPWVAISCPLETISCITSGWFFAFIPTTKNVVFRSCSSKRSRSRGMIRAFQTYSPWLRRLGISATSGWLPWNTHSASRSKVKQTLHFAPSGQTFSALNGISF